LIDFEAQLRKLLELESAPLPQNEFTELASAGRQLLLSLNKKQADISMQVEELYELAVESDNSSLNDALKAEKERTRLSVNAAISLCDLIDDFCEFARKSDNGELEHHAFLMRKKAGTLLEESGITGVGSEGQRLDPDIHNVSSAIVSNMPREQVVKVLQNGYRHFGTIIRKATVVVSHGEDERKDFS